jgi:hypothetical protein
MITTFVFLLLFVCHYTCRTRKQKQTNIDTLEEEKKINSLKESHEWDSSEAKDQLSLSSTSLPDVGIHEPEFHVKG